MPDSVIIGKGVAINVILPIEILNRIEEEKNMLEDKPKENKKQANFKGFAERRSK